MGKEQVRVLGADRPRGGHHAQRVEPRGPQPGLFGKFAESGVGGSLVIFDEATGQISDLRVVQVVVLRDHGDLPAVHGKDSYGDVLTELVAKSSQVRTQLC